MATATKPQLLTNKEAAEFIGVQPHTLETWRSTRRYGIPFVRSGGKIFYLAEDLIEWLKSRRVHVAELQVVRR